MFADLRRELECIGPLEIRKNRDREPPLGHEEENGAHARLPDDFPDHFVPVLPADAPAVPLLRVFAARRFLDRAQRLERFGFDQLPIGECQRKSRVVRDNGTDSTAGQVTAVVWD